MRNGICCRKCTILRSQNGRSYLIADFRIGVRQLNSLSIKVSNHLCLVNSCVFIYRWPSPRERNDCRRSAIGKRLITDCPCVDQLMRVLRALARFAVGHVTFIYSGCKYMLKRLRSWVYFGIKFQIMFLLMSISADKESW